ncbi:MAG: phosphoglucosamine mutase [Bacteroidota bacterium]
MALIKSISGIRGTIGGKKGENLTPQDIVECTAAFAQWLINEGQNKKIIIGRDARISGRMVNQLVVNTLIGMGFDVIDLGLSTTPTVEIAVPMENAGAGIILTASHNPKEWNALKLLNHKGEFISKEDGAAFLDLLKSGAITYAAVDQLGSYKVDDSYLAKHIDLIVNHPMVDVEKVEASHFNVVVDAINSSGAIAIPLLLDRLGVRYTVLNSEPNGQFAHNPEPLEKYLTGLSKEVVNQKADLGIVVDPDVDRLAFMNEDGSMFGEEYTLVAIADYILGKNKGNTVSNLSSTKALRDVTEKHGGTYYASAVGEVNVVKTMKANNAVIGGEGNGGIIVPDLHYGRDALIGIALFLSHLATFGENISKLRATYPTYYMIKDKIALTPEIDLQALLNKLENQFKEENYNRIDGLKIDYPDGWVHLRGSNTEPIIRVYSEGPSQERAQELADQMKKAAAELI